MNLTPSSDDFEVSLELPRGHRLLKLVPFPHAGFDVVTHERLAEDLVRDLAFGQALTRLEQVARQALRVLAFVGAAFDGFVCELQPFFDAVQAASICGRDGEVGIDVR